MSILLDGVCRAITDEACLIPDCPAAQEKDGPSNLVTEADIRVESFLRDRLTRLLPGAGFVGEESEADFGNGCRFIVDPIDGTANLTRSMGLSAVSVGLLRDGEPVLGAVYNPKTGELFCGEQGQGATLNGKKIHVSGRDFRHSVVFTAFSLYRKQYTGICRRVLDRIYPGCDDFRRLGSAALELAYIAAGRAELYFEARVYPWDCCAGVLLIREAGGYIAAPHSDRIDFTCPTPLIAANSAASLAFLRKAVLAEMPELPADYFN